MPVGERSDPYRNFRFRVEIDGVEAGGFSEVSGLHHDIETEDYVEGGVNGYVHKLPKSVKHPNVVLKRGLTDADNLWKWQHSVGKKRAKIERKTINVILLDDQGQAKVTWRCLQAYPVKWGGPDLKGDANTIAIETLELAHCGIERT